MLRNPRSERCWQQKWNDEGWAKAKSNIMSARPREREEWKKNEKKIETKKRNKSQLISLWVAHKMNGTPKCKGREANGTKMLSNINLLQS